MFRTGQVLPAQVELSLRETPFTSWGPAVLAPSHSGLTYSHLRVLAWEHPAPLPRCLCHLQQGVSVPFPSCVSQRVGQTGRTPQGSCPGGNSPWEVVSRPLRMGGMAAHQARHAWLRLRGLLAPRTSAAPESGSSAGAETRPLVWQVWQASLRSDGSRSHGDPAAGDLKCSTRLQPRPGPRRGTAGERQARRSLTWALGPEQGQEDLRVGKAVGSTQPAAQGGPCVLTAEYKQPCLLHPTGRPRENHAPGAPSHNLVSSRGESWRTAFN